jgi:hypothetical protein
MKKLLHIYLIIAVMFSISCQNSFNNIKDRFFISEETKASLIYVIDTLEIMKNDIGVSMYLPDAEEIALAKGDGWRIPTFDELNVLYKNRQKIGGFSTDSNTDETIYMSSTESNDGGTYRTIKVIDFSNGKISSGYYTRGPVMKVRFVRPVN